MGPGRVSPRQGLCTHGRRCKPYISIFPSGPAVFVLHDIFAPLLPRVVYRQNGQNFMEIANMRLGWGLGHRPPAPLRWEALNR